MVKSLSRVFDAYMRASAVLPVLCVGLYISMKLSFAQLALFPRAVRIFVRQFRFRGHANTRISSLRALSTALAATVGTGNLVGVAGAICLGGPGAIFWMWICALLGMATKYAEILLAVRYRVPDGTGWKGGPMYVMANGLRAVPLARVYCILGVIAAFGVGNAAQINAATAGIHEIMSSFGIEVRGQYNLLIGLLLGVYIGFVLIRGPGSIGKAAQVLVPLAVVCYLGMGTVVLIRRADYIPAALQEIFNGAFSPKAATGGVIGSALRSLCVGCSRGVFTNEAGMGTAAIAHASADVQYPGQQALMGIVEVFLDTIVMCSMTAFVILTSGVHIPYGGDHGAELTTQAFEAVCGSFAGNVLGVIMILLSVATVIGWALYGARCAEFLFGSRSWHWFAALQTIITVISAMMDTATVWKVSETINGLMAIPNLITLAALTPEVVRLTKDYKRSDFSQIGGRKQKYADIHQCKSL